MLARQRGKQTQTDTNRERERDTHKQTQTSTNKQPVQNSSATALYSRAVYTYELFVLTGCLYLRPVVLTGCLYLRAVTNTACTYAPDTGNTEYGEVTGVSEIQIEMQILVPRIEVHWNVGVWVRARVRVCVCVCGCVCVCVCAVPCRAVRCAAYRGMLACACARAHACPDLPNALKS